ncbi:hypothetical protein [Acidipropionibacterium jensenii]|uniref:hypothetical protein n=1 Tax=Acidipropionibacterium jensenii TaxID=1749 RepID=UPI00214C3DD8|nr:hypothetical protein [Acidipropionibacterium jensenii]
MASVMLFGVPMDALELADLVDAEMVRRQLSGRGRQTVDLDLISRRAREFAATGESDPGRWSGGAWVTLTEWCSTCGVPVRTARDWAAASKIRARRSGRTWLVVADEIPPTRKER